MRSLPVKRRHRNSATEVEQLRLRIKDAIATHWDHKGYAPTVRDLAAACEISSSNVFHHLQVMEDRGVIIREPRVFRSIRLSPRLSPDQ